MRAAIIRTIFFFLFIALIESTFAQLTPIVDSIPMGDGRKLAADIYIPSAITTGPVILIQTPYNRLYYRFTGLPLQIGTNLNASNFIFVIVDWRGFYGSSAAAHSGSPSLGEDGYDCVEWIAQQSWSNGKIGTLGASALGRIQFQTAKKNPPHLSCICPLVAGPQYDYTEYFPNGTLRTEYVQQLDVLGFGISPVLMANPVHNNLWTFAENTNFYPDSIRVPCLMIGGWYDHTIEFMLPFFNAIRSHSPVNVRNQHRLLMGPWVHGGHGTAQVGSSTQGELSYPNATHWNDSFALLFFDYNLRNINNGWDTSPIVQYYQMGDNIWLSSTSWPPSGVTNTDFFFHKNGILDNTLPSNTDDSLIFNYDPTDPSPTIGGPTLRSDLKQGPYDQTDSVESRNDILIFTTNTLTQNVVMKGNATIHLKVTSNKLDTDFDIRLTDVYPDGRSMLINDGVIRMRFRNGNTTNDTASMIPGTIYDCSITLPNTAITFLVGHKIRIDISSSNYPRFNRNMNTGGAMYPGNNLDVLVNPVIATNTIYTNSTNRSYITLPLVDYTNEIKEQNTPDELVTIFPNPSSDKLIVDFKGIGNIANPITTYEIRISNELGQQIFTKKISNSESNNIDISQFNSGIYFVSVIINKQNIYRKKIVITK